MGYDLHIKYANYVLKVYEVKKLFLSFFKFIQFIRYHFRAI